MGARELLTKRTARKAGSLRLVVMDAGADGTVTIDEYRLILAASVNVYDDATDTHHRQAAARLLMHDVEDVRHTDTVLARAGVSFDDLAVA